MGCEEIKKLIPAYIKHTAASQEIKEVEEHLCICDNCRRYLATVMDKEEDFKEKIEHPESVPNNTDIQIVSEKEIPPQEIPLNSQEEEKEQEEEKKEEKITEEKEPIKPETKKEEAPQAEAPAAEKVTKEPPKPKEEKKSGLFEYLVLIIGIAVLVFLVRLLMKG